MKPTVGEMTLIDERTAYCRVRWSPGSRAASACIFSVHIETFRGESWKARELKAVAEARRVAATFLQSADIDVRL